MTRFRRDIYIADGVTTYLDGLLYNLHSPQSPLIKWELIAIKSH
ncbi:hypothetical protein NIES3807_36270 [Microcystis aeruginosa NIES-3807]|uniref:Uncharacterized protein n=1 Tax=Microcystis aeruginosa NIES-3807 TaxID=2517785 RepID=A0AAD3GAC8_MICAE|nr:hypothetical protein NIES3807_36270 [Microcystis aeruginosa NIES-3807]